MFRKIHLLRLFGVEVSIDYTWFVIFGLVAWGLATNYFPETLPGMDLPLYWIMGVAASAFLFVSVLFHELSHSLVARQNGLEIRGITLFIFGGMAEMSEEPRDPSTELRMAAAGPVASVAIAVACWALFAVTRDIISLPLGVVLQYIAYLNMGLALFNLVPGFPLDGGRILRAILWKRSGDLKKATLLASRTGKWFAYLLILLGLLSLVTGHLGGLWYVLIGMFLHQAAQASYMRVAQKQQLLGLKVGDLMSRDVVVVDASLPLDRLVEEYFLKHRFQGFPVRDGDRITGCVTLHDVKEVPRSQWSKAKVGDVQVSFSPDQLLDAEADAVEALGVMLRTGQGRLPVFFQGRLAGIITRRDIMDLFHIKTDLGA